MSVKKTPSLHQNRRSRTLKDPFIKNDGSCDLLSNVYLPSTLVLSQFPKLSRNLRAAGVALGSTGPMKNEGSNSYFVTKAAETIQPLEIGFNIQFV
jgi:hypothetical protein